MDKKAKIYLGLFLFLVLAIIYYEYSKPKPINWFPSYIKKHKIPYGTYVLRNELSTLLNTDEIEDVKIPPYIFLEDSTKTGTYIFIDAAVNFDDAEFMRLLKFVARGNDVFMSTHGAIIDTLNLETESLLTSNLDEKVFFKMANKKLSSTEFSFDRGFRNQVFTKIDTLKSTVLGKTGYIDKNGERTEEGINFIKYSHGKGSLYFHTFPELFTNYYLLKDNNNKHTAAVLSYIDNEKPIYWDEYYKTGKTKIGSPMHYLLNNLSLKWAYYTVLIGILFFVLFEGKRKQRYIPIVTPLKNQTLAFTRTIANMYYEKSKHKDIAEHKINYLLDFIRMKLRIPTNKIDKTFYKYVASRSGNSIENIEKLFKYCDEIHLKNTVTKEELLILNTLIEDFKNSIN
ncbi:MAG: DUF4350 domain-containing protein [Flavobacteriaceae bacterium]|nr:DUF4350 domain-containing protein [Flavobacteriaceae bacterium]